MLDGPVTFKKSKAKRAQRTRDLGADPDVTSGADADTGDDSPSVLATKLKNKLKTRNKPQTRLSFGGPDEEGDGEEFKVKKSNLSRKIALNKSAASTIPVPTTPSSSGPTYTSAYLNELKASTPSTRPKLVEDASISYDADISMADPDASSVSQLVDLTGDDAQETVIPTSSSIQAARQKREHARKTGVAEDFISLSITKRDDYAQGPHPMSRLVREEDELGEGDDEFAEYTSAQERIALGKKSRKLEVKKKREEMNELIADAEEQDEETMEWEQEQLRRGGHITEDAQPSTQQLTYKPTPIPPATPIPTLAPAIARLTQSLSSLTTSHAQHTASMTSLGSEQTQLEVREAEMRQMIAKAEAKRSWFVAFREWVESVATFLDEKFPKLEELEEEQVSLLQERYELVSKRRERDDEDDLEVLFGVLPIPPGRKDGEEEQADELGRAVPQVNPTVARKERLSAREARRMYRRARSQGQTQEEGYSTDGSLPPSDATDYDLAIEKLLEKGRDVLSDVKAKDFRDPTVGLGKWFGEWREKFGDSYTGAWGGLGMVGAWEFWTRLEVLGWDPIEKPKTLDTFAWYQSLHEYSRPAQSEDDMDTEGGLGPDGDLVSAMISTAIIPRIAKILEKGALDPYSAKNIRRLIDLCEEIEISVPRDNLKFELILKSVFLTFQTAITSTLTTLTPYLELNQARFDPSSIPARRRFLVRRLKLLTNLLKWRKYAGDKYGLGKLVETLVERVMLRVAEGGWEVGGEEVMRKVEGMLPRELVPASLKVRLSMR